MSAIPILFVLAPLAIFVIIALRDQKKSITDEEFFESRGLVSASEFANSSVAYGFQIASVSVFFAFGYYYGIGGAVNPVFWGIGIIFFTLFVGRLGAFFGTTQTLHGFLGSRYKSRWITKTASVMTLIGFLGAFTAELVWGSYVLTIISDDPWFIGVSMVAMAAVVTWYVARAGHLSVIRTDQYQVVFAHAAFVVLVVFLVTLLHWKGDNAQAVGFLLSLISSGILLFICFSIARQVRGSSPAADAGVGRLVSFTVLGVMGLGSVVSVVNTIIFSQSMTSMDVIIQDTQLYDFNQGSLNLLSLALLPLCWHFSDVTMWQRLGATRLPPEGDPARFREIRRALIRYAIESPGSWLLALIAGVALRYADIGIDETSVWNGIAEIPVAILSTETQAGLLVQHLVAGLFVAGIVAAMLSTADSFLIASTFTFVQDLSPAETDAAGGMRKQAAAVTKGRAAAIAFVVVGLSSYWIATYFEVDLLTILFGAFGAQVSLFPAVFGTILLGDRAASRRWTFGSIVAGFVGALWAMSVALGDQNWALYPPLFALVTSSFVYLLGVGVSSGGSPKIQFKLLTLSLLVILFAPPAIYFLQDHGFPIRDGKGNAITFWLIWELLSIVVTLVVTVVFWLMIFFGRGGAGNSDAAIDGAKGVQSFPAVVSFFAFLFSFLAAGYFAYQKGPLEVQVVCLFVGVLSTVCLQSVSLSAIHTRLGDEYGKLENAAGHAQKVAYAQTIRHKIGERDNFIKYLCFSDVPIAIAIGTLALLVIFYSAMGEKEILDEMRVFVAGAVAIQLLYSNLVFWLEAFAQTDKGYDLLGRLCPPLRPIRDMLRPEKNVSEGFVVVWAKREMRAMFGTPP